MFNAREPSTTRRIASWSAFAPTSEQSYHPVTGAILSGVPDASKATAVASETGDYNTMQMVFKW